ncbi:MAG: hypothetical protein ACWA5K_04725 [bacterium]
MKVVKKTAEYTIYEKRSGRHAVKGADKQWINGEEKAKILLAEDLIKLTAPAAPEPEPVEEVEEAATEETAEAEPTEEVAEEPAEEEAPSEEEPSAGEEPSADEEPSEEEPKE